jgi:hypothetical protein
MHFGSRLMIGHCKIRWSDIFRAGLRAAADSRIELQPFIGVTEAG